MPNWKKVVVSGSDAVLNSVTASFTGSLTGALIGTASFATSASQATSASYALTASFALNGGGGATFPYVGNAVITGSLIVSGANGGIDTNFNNVGLEITDVDGRALFIGGVTYGRNLNGFENNSSVDWGNRILNDSSGVTSADWNGRILYEPGGTEALNYSNSASVSSQLYYNNVIPAQVQRELAETPIYAGQVIQATINVSAVDYNLVSLDTDGVWKDTKALVGYGADKMLGICVDEANGYVLIEGDIGASDDNSQGVYVVGADHGLPIYISTSTGELTVTAPTGAGSIVRIVGYVYYNSSTDANWWTMKFRPSNEWYEI